MSESPKRRESDQYTGAQILIGVGALLIASAIALIAIWKGLKTEGCGIAIAWPLVALIAMFIFFAGVMMPTDKFLRGLSIARLWRRNGGDAPR